MICFRVHVIKQSYHVELPSRKTIYVYAPGSFWSPGSSRSPSPAVRLQGTASHQVHTPITPNKSQLAEPADEGSHSSSPQGSPITTTSAASVSVKQLVSRDIAVPQAEGDEHAVAVHTPTSQPCDPPMQCSDEESLHSDLSDIEPEGPLQHLRAEDTVLLDSKTRIQLRSGVPGCEPSASGSSSSIAGGGQSSDAECSHQTAGAQQCEPQCCLQGVQQPCIEDSCISASQSDHLRVAGCPAVYSLDEGEVNCSQAAGNPSLESALSLIHI